MNELVEVNIHGHLAEELGQSQWYLDVSSVKEAFHAIDMISNRQFTKLILKYQKTKGRCKILVNEEEMDVPNKEMADLEELNEKKLSEISAVFDIERKMKKIDLIPIVEGAEGFITVLLAVVLVIVAVVFQQWYLLPIAFGLLMAGVSALLAKPPDFGDFREIQQVGKKDSYLFNGPTNQIGEGGPVTIGYGRLIVGSLCVQASQTSEDRLAFVQDATAPTKSSNVQEIIFDLGHPEFGFQVLDPQLNKITTR